MDAFLCRVAASDASVRCACRCLRALRVRVASHAKRLFARYARRADDDGTAASPPAGPLMRDCRYASILALMPCSFDASRADDGRELIFPAVAILLPCSAGGFPSLTSCVSLKAPGAAPSASACMQASAGAGSGALRSMAASVSLPREACASEATERYEKSHNSQRCREAKQPCHNRREIARRAAAARRPPPSRQAASSRLHRSHIVS